MRFVRIYTRSDTGEVVAVIERETPFTVTGISCQGEPYELEMHELGVVKDFTPVDVDGNPTSPARHIRERLERRPQRPDDGVFDPTVPAIAALIEQFQWKPGHEPAAPEIAAVPTTIEGIEARIRARGLESIPTRIRAWLALMLEPAVSARLEVGRGIPISALRALDAQRQRRDPRCGSRAFVFEREAQQRSDSHAAARTRARLEKAAAKAARAAQKTIARQQRAWVPPTTENASEGRSGPSTTGSEE